MNTLAPTFIDMTHDNCHMAAALEHQLHMFPWSLKKFQDALSAGYPGWLMYQKESLIGYAVTMQILDEAHLLTIGIAEEHQSQGWGTKLLRFLFDWAHPLGAQSFFLEVRPSNTPALALYRRAGFETVGRRKNYYTDANGKEDALVMKAAI